MNFEDYLKEALNFTSESCQQEKYRSSHHKSLKTFFCEKSAVCLVYYRAIGYRAYRNRDVLCDGIVNCPHGEDEDFIKCKAKKIFPKSATIECQNKYFPTMTILATPCNNITECSDGADEKYCGLDQKISKYFVSFSICFFIALSLVLTIVIVIYAKKNNLLTHIFINDFVVNGTKRGINGDALANLKVTKLYDLIFK